MNLIPILGLLGGGYLAFKTLKPSKLQGTTAMTPVGIPVRVLTPVSEEVTIEQTTGIPKTSLPARRPSVLPAPKKPTSRSLTSKIPSLVTTTSTGIVYAPPKAIQPNQSLPVVVTPTGSTSIGIASVTDVQKSLNTLGFQPLLKTDGVLGPKTISNIRTFQSKNGLVVDGNAGPATKAALANAISKLASSGAEHIGNQAETPLPNANTLTALDVQRLLNKAGANPQLKVDGKVGPMTVAAIKTFQVRHGLAPDGVAGPKTKSALILASGEA